MAALAGDGASLSQFLRSLVTKGVLSCETRLSGGCGGAGWAAWLVEAKAEKSCLIGRGRSDDCEKNFVGGLVLGNLSQVPHAHGEDMLILSNCVVCCILHSGEDAEC